MFSLYIFISIFLPTYGLVMLLYNLWSWLTGGNFTSRIINEVIENVEECNGK